MTSSAIPAVKEAIEAILNAAPDVDVEVLWGKPDPLPDAYVSIWAAQSSREFRGLGVQPPPLDEEFEITLVAEKLLAGADYKAVELRAWEIAAAAETALRADTKLNDSATFSRLSQARQEWFRVDTQRGCRVFFTVAGKARI